jgi:hypothetical protein
MLNRSGESGHPCLIQFFPIKCNVGYRIVVYSPYFYYFSPAYYWFSMFCFLRSLRCSIRLFI